MNVELMLRARKARKSHKTSWQQVKETLDMATRCSWVDGHGHRVQGTFVRWDREYPDYGLVKQLSGTKGRVHKSNITFELA